jgi:hypothetical protein
VEVAAAVVVAVVPEVVVDVVAVVADVSVEVPLGIAEVLVVELVSVVLIVLEVSVLVEVLEVSVVADVSEVAVVSSCLLQAIVKTVRAAMQRMAAKDFFMCDSSLCLIVVGVVSRVSACVIELGVPALTSLPSRETEAIVAARGSAAGDWSSDEAGRSVTSP